MKTLRILLAAALVNVAGSASALDRVLPAPRIKDNGDVRLSDDLKIGNYQGGKFILQPDTLQLLGSGSTGDVTNMSVRTPKAPGGQSLAVFLSSSARSVLDYIPRQYHAAICNSTNTVDLTGWINNALNDTNNNAVLFPSGCKYRVRGLRVDRAKLSIFAYGAVIENEPAFRAAVLRVVAPANNVVVYGGEWIGSGLIGYTLPLPNGYEGGGLYFGGVQDVGVKDATVRQAFSCGICMEGNERVYAENNRVYGVYFGPGIGTSYTNFSHYAFNLVVDTVAEGLTIDNFSHDNIVYGNRLYNAGFLLPGQPTPPNGVGFGCFGGIGAGASSNYNVFDSNIIKNTSCNGIGLSGKNNRIVNNIIERVGYNSINTGSGIELRYYAGTLADGTGSIVSDQGGNYIAGNSFTDIKTWAILMEHDTFGNVIGPNNYNGYRIADATNGTQGNRFSPQSGFVLVNSTATAALKFDAFGAYVQTQGATDWQPTLPPADAQSGGQITFFCNSVAQTIKPPAGAFGGPYGNGAATKACPSNASITFRSDGFGWQIIQSSVN